MIHFMPQGSTCIIALLIKNGPVGKDKQYICIDIQQSTNLVGIVKTVIHKSCNE